MEFIIVGLMGLIGAPFLGHYIGAHATLVGFTTFSVISLGFGLYWGKYSTFDTGEGPLYMALCYSSFWFLLWMFFSFVISNRELIQPYADSVKDLLFK